jgi:hypothetical protein
VFSLRYFFNEPALGVPIFLLIEKRVRNAHGKAIKKREENKSMYKKVTLSRIETPRVFIQLGPMFLLSFLYTSTHNISTSGIFYIFTGVFSNRNCERPAKISKLYWRHLRTFTIDTYIGAIVN